MVGCDVWVGGVRRVRDYPRELDNFEKLGSKFLTIVTKFCEKNPLNGPSNFGLITYRFSTRDI